MSELLKKTIAESGLSANELWKLTGVSQPTISEFLRGKDIRHETAQKMADYFGMTLCIRKRKRD